MVATDGPSTVVVEVKTGRRPPGGWAPGRRPGDRFRPEAARRRARAARRLAGPRAARVDLVEVTVGPVGVRLRREVVIELPATAARRAP